MKTIDFCPRLTTATLNDGLLLHRRVGMVGGERNTFSTRCALGQENARSACGHCGPGAALFEGERDECVQ